MAGDEAEEEIAVIAGIARNRPESRVIASIGSRVKDLEMMIGDMVL